MRVYRVDRLPRGGDRTRTQLSSPPGSPFVFKRAPSQPPTQSARMSFTGGEGASPRLKQIICMAKLVRRMHAPSPAGRYELCAELRCSSVMLSLNKSPFSMIISHLNLVVYSTVGNLAKASPRFEIRKCHFDTKLLLRTT